MLSDEKIINNELDIKLKAMEETERIMIERFKNKLLILEENGCITRSNVVKLHNILEKEFDEKWFK